jgi:flagellar hook assembly protein FlgD
MVVFGGFDGTAWLDEVWSLEGLSDAVSAPVSAPGAISLRAYPNPFRDQATVEFRLPRAMDAEVAVYELGGRLVRTLREGAAAAGESRVTWDGRGASGRPVPAGVYWVRLRGEAMEQARRVVAVR